MSGFKVAGVQMDVVYANRERNLSSIIEHMRTLATANVRLIVFPECVVSGYCYPDLESARAQSISSDGPEIKKLTEVCREVGLHIIVGFLESDSNRIHNSVACIGPQGVVAKYRKIHLPYLGVDRFTTPGNKLDVFEVGPLKIGMLICYDCSFPEASRVLMLQGADLIVLPTNWPPTSGRTADYIPNARALENHVYFMAVNRVGEENGFTFVGKSRIVDPRGADLAFADHDQETTLIAEIDYKLARQKRLINIPGVHEVDRLNDRRPHTYQLISKVNTEP